MSRRGGRRSHHGDCNRSGGCGRDEVLPHDHSPEQDIALAYTGGQARRHVSLSDLTATLPTATHAQSNACHSAFRLAAAITAFHFSVSCLLRVTASAWLPPSGWIPMEDQRCTRSGDFSTALISA